MSDWENISYEEFIDVYNLNPPNKYIKKIYEFFSHKEEHSDFKIINIYFYFILFVFSLGLFGTIFKIPKEIIKIFTLTYVGFLSIFVIVILGAIVLNNFRLKKMMKLLNVNKKEYNLLVDKYFNSNNE